MHFIENHDEKRAAHELSDEQHKAAAVVMAAGAGARLIYDGQMRGHKVHIPVHLDRGPEEQDSPVLIDFYEKLLPVASQIDRKTYTWRQLEVKGKFGLKNHRVVSTCWSSEDGIFLVLVNYSDKPTKTSINLPVTTEKEILISEGVSLQKPLQYKLEPWAYTIRKY